MKSVIAKCQLATLARTTTTTTKYTVLDLSGCTVWAKKKKPPLVTVTTTYLDCEGVILFPSFLHTMCGVGSPLATQRREAMPPAFTRWGEGDSTITGGSETEEEGERRIRG